jgi:hypothetical protein
MTPETRRSLALLLATTAATLVALAVASLLRERACVDAGGRWVARSCVLAAGPESSVARAYLLGAIVGVAALLFLWRTYTFFATRGARKG